jgi:hypothetical protein
MEPFMELKQKMASLVKNPTCEWSLDIPTCEWSHSSCRSSISSSHFVVVYARVVKNLDLWMVSRYPPARCIYTRAHVINPCPEPPQIEIIIKMDLNTHLTWYKYDLFCDERRIILYDSWVHQHVIKHSWLQNSTHAVNSTTQNLTC